MRLKTKTKLKAQTLLELMGVTLTLLGFFFLALLLFSIFEVSQKQTILTRTQAFIELGNHSDYGQRAFGDDDPENEESQVRFYLGEKSDGINMVNLESITAFKEAVEGELNLNGGSGASSAFWNTYRFPKRLTRVFGGVGADGNLIPIELEVSLAIAHNRSIDFEKEGTETTGEYSTSVHLFRDLEQLPEFYKKARDPSYGEELQRDRGMQSNQDLVLAALKKMVAEDKDLHEKAKYLEENLSVGDVLESVAVNFAIQAAINLALSFAFDVIGSAISQAGGAAAGAGAGAGAASNASGGASSFGQGLSNVGNALQTASLWTSIADMGLTLSGNRIEGLGTASRVMGGAGMALNGLAGLDKFFNTGGFDTGQTSLFFNSGAQTLGGAGSLVGLADANAGRAFGLGSQAMRLGGGITGMNENWDTWASQAGGGFKQMSALGSTVSHAAGFGSQLGGSNDFFSGVGLIGDGFSTIGGLGITGIEIGAGKFDGKNFDLMTKAGGLTSQVSGLAMSTMTLVGETSGMEALGVASLVGAGISMTGAMGNMAVGVIEAAPKVVDDVGKVLGGELALGDAFGDVSFRSGGEGFNQEAFDHNLEVLNKAGQATATALQVAQAMNSDSTNSANPSMNPSATLASPSNLSEAERAARADSFATAIAQANASGGATAQLDQFLNNMDLNQAKTAAQMSGEDAAIFERDFLAAKRAISELKKSYDKGELPDEKKIDNARMAATRAQKIIDKYNKKKSEKRSAKESQKTKRESEEDERDKSIDLQDVANQAIEWHRYYRKLESDHFRVVGYVRNFESNLMGKRIVEKDPQRRRFLRSEGKRISKEIQTLREKHISDDNPLAPRLKRAEYHLRNLNFVSPKEAFDELEDAILKVKNTRLRAIEKLRDLRQACHPKDHC